MSEQFMIMGPGEYRTRGGEKATVDEVIGVTEAKSNEWEYCADGTASDIEWMWYRNGRLFKDETSEFDIVGPWVEEKKEEPPPMEVPPGLVVNEKASFSEAPKTKEQLFGVAAGKFLEEVNTIYEGQARTCVVSVTVDLGEYEKCVTSRAGTLSSALGLVECVKRKLVDELERTWR